MSLNFYYVLTEVIQSHDTETLKEKVYQANQFLVKTVQHVVPPSEVKELCKSLAEKSSLCPEIEKSLILPIMRLFLQEKNDEKMKVIQESVFDLICKNVFTRDLCKDTSVDVKRHCISFFTKFATFIGPSLTEIHILPVYDSFSRHADPVIRKACVDASVTLSFLTTYKGRNQILAPLFIKFLTDQAQLVMESALISMGPFIATFADSDKTGLYYVGNGMVSVHPNKFYDNNSIGDKVDENYNDDSGYMYSDRQSPNDGQLDQLFPSLSLDDDSHFDDDKCVLDAFANAGHIDAHDGDDDDDEDADGCRADTDTDADADVDTDADTHTDNGDNNTNSDANVYAQENVQIIIRPLTNDTNQIDSTQHLESQEHLSNKTDSTDNDFKEDDLSYSFDDQKDDHTWKDFQTDHLFPSPIQSTLDTIQSRIGHPTIQASAADHQQVSDPFHGTSDVCGPIAPPLNPQPDDEQNKAINSQLVNASTQDQTDYEVLHAEFNTFVYWRDPLPNIELEIQSTCVNNNNVGENEHKSKCVDTSVSFDSLVRSVTNGNYSLLSATHSNPYDHGDSLHRALTSAHTDHHNTQEQTVHALSGWTCSDYPDAVHDPKYYAEFSGLYQNVQQQMGPIEQDILPNELLEYFVKMSNATYVSDLYSTNITYHCAFSLPAVAFTLGPDHWQCLRRTFFNLIKNTSTNIRCILASSLYPIALIVGREHTSRDLFDAFKLFLTDMDEVRIRLVPTFIPFVKLLNDQEREELLPKLTSFLLLENMLNWRFRVTFCELFQELIPLYRKPMDFKKYIIKMMFNLLKDKVAEVRKSAIKVAGSLVRHMFSLRHFSLMRIQLLNMIGDFFKAQKWSYRQTFVSFCEHVLFESIVPMDVFDEHLLKPLLNLTADPVANVRLTLSRLVGRLPYSDKKELIKHAQVRAAIQSLATDSDKDVREQLDLYGSCSSEYADTSSLTEMDDQPSSDPHALHQLHQQPSDHQQQRHLDELTEKMITDTDHVSEFNGHAVPTDQQCKTSQDYNLDVPRIELMQCDDYNTDLTLKQAQFDQSVSMATDDNKMDFIEMVNLNHVPADAMDTTDSSSSVSCSPSSSSSHQQNILNKPTVLAEPMKALLMLDEQIHGSSSGPCDSILNQFKSTCDTNDTSSQIISSSAVDVSVATVAAPTVPAATSTSIINQTALVTETTSVAMATAGTIISSNANVNSATSSPTTTSCNTAATTCPN